METQLRVLFPVCFVRLTTLDAPIILPCPHAHQMHPLSLAAPSFLFTRNEKNDIQTRDEEEGGGGVKHADLSEIEETRSTDLSLLLSLSVTV